MMERIMIRRSRVVIVICPSLEDTVNGILKFMHRKGIISVAPRELNAAVSAR